MIELRILGRIELRDAAGEDARAVLSQPKRLALLVYLALHHARGFLRRDTIVATFWPELDDAHARGALSQALRFLRRELGDGVIERRGEEEITLSSDTLLCDAVEFDRACSAGDVEEALRLHRGQLLAGFFISDAPEFEQWLDGERARTARAYAQALEAVAHRCTAQGDSVRAAECWRRCVEAEPYNGAVAVKLMAALVEAGDRAGAIAHARVHERRLATELQAQPDAAVANFAEQLRRPDHATRPNGDPFPHGVRSSTPAPTPPLGVSVQQDSGPPARRASDAAGLTDPTGFPPAPTRSPAGRWAAGLALWRPHPAWIGTLAVAVALFGMLSATRRARQGLVAADNKRVAVLALENQTGRPDLDFIGLEVQDWITRGLQETGLVRVFGATPTATVSTASTNGGLPSGERSWAAGVGVGTLISGRYYLRGDSVLFHVQLTAVADGKVIATPNVVVASVKDPTPAIDTLRQRTIGALAAHLDPALTEWASFASQPPSFEAYRQFSEGLKAYYRDEFAIAIRHWLRAPALDTGYVYPLLMAAWLRPEIQTAEFPTSDSLLRIVRVRHQVLAPFDEAFARVLEAGQAGDPERAFEAAKELRKYVAPGSNWELDAVAAAVELNRPHEARAIARTIDVNREAEMDHWDVFVPVSNAFHLGGEDAELLVRLHRDAGKWHHIWAIIEMEMRALAALSRAAEVDSVWRTLLRSRDADAVSEAMEAAAMGASELRAYGLPDAARRLAVEALDSLPRLPDSSRFVRYPLIEKMKVLREAGREREALPIARLLTAKYPERAGLLATLAVLAVHMGDTATARQIDARLAARKGDRTQIRLAFLARARIAATLGRPDSAVALLHAACDHGCRFMEDIHAILEFDRLRSYGPFREFLRPRG